MNYSATTFFFFIFGFGFFLLTNYITHTIPKTINVMIIIMKSIKSGLIVLPSPSG